MNGVSGCDDDDNSVFHPNDTVIAAQDLCNYASDPPF